MHSAASSESGTDNDDNKSIGVVGDDECVVITDDEDDVDAHGEADLDIYGLSMMLEQKRVMSEFGRLQRTM